MRITVNTMSDITSSPYKWLWQERTIRSVANLTRKDAVDFFKQIKNISIKTEIQKYSLVKANIALNDLLMGVFQGASMLIIGEP